MQARDLRVAADDIGERSGLLGPAVAADVVIVNVEWRMVDEQQGQLIRLATQHLLQPGLSRLAKDALALSVRCRVNRDESCRMLLYHVVEKVAAFRQVGIVAKRDTHFVLVIAIARHDIKRCLQRRQQLAKARVLIRLTVLRRIAGEDDDIGLLVINSLDAAPQAVGPQLGCGLIRCRRQDVRIANLGNQHSIQTAAGCKLRRRFPRETPSVDDVIDGGFFHCPLAGFPVVLGQGKAMPVFIVELHMITAIVIPRPARFLAEHRVMRHRLGSQDPVLKFPRPLQLVKVFCPKVIEVFLEHAEQLKSAGQ